MFGHFNASCLLKGRKDVIEAMLLGNEDIIRSEIDKEQADSPPSLPYLAVAADFLECSRWWVIQCCQFYF